MKKTLAYLGLLAAVTLGPAAAAGAAVAATSAPAFPPGCGAPFTANNSSGNMYAIGSNDINAGTSVITVNRPGRSLCFDPTSSGGTYIRYDNGNYMAANSTCSGITIKSSQSSNGVVWHIISAGADHFYFTNQFCGSGTSAKLSSDNHFNTQWTICFDLAGCFERMDIH